MCCVSRYTKQRAKPPRTPRSIHSGGHPQASPAASAKRVGSYKPGPKTAAHLATQLSATSRRATPGRMPLPEVRFLNLFHMLDPPQAVTSSHFSSYPQTPPPGPYLPFATLLLAPCPTNVGGTYIILRHEHCSHAKLQFAACTPSQFLSTCV